MKQINSDKVFTICNYVVALLFLLIALYPLWYVVICSFSNMSAIMSGQVWIVPVRLTFAGYRRMFAESSIWNGYKWTILYTLVGTCVNLFFTIPAAYALTKRSLPFRKTINIYFMLTMFIGGGLIPTYLWIDKLHLTNTFTILVLLGAVNVWNMIICRTFFESNIPEELIDAAKIDGSSDIGIFIRVVLPLSKSILAVMILFFAVGHWNSYFNALIYLRDTSRQPLQLVLRTLLMSTQLLGDTLGEGSSRTLMEVQNIKYCVVIAASLPVLILYPFIQKHFVKGVMIGAVKG